MPDGRLRGSTAYSTNPSTLANRRRLATMDPSQREPLRKKTSEYQAIWQLLNRVSHKTEYKAASHGLRRTMLQTSLTSLMDKRRREGKMMCETDGNAMIERHLKKEYQKSLDLRHLRGVALDPSPHARSYSPCEEQRHHHHHHHLHCQHPPSPPDSSFSLASDVNSQAALETEDAFRALQGHQRSGPGCDAEEGVEGAASDDMDVKLDGDRLENYPVTAPDGTQEMLSDILRNYNAVRRSMSLLSNQIQNLHNCLCTCSTGCDQSSYTPSMSGEDFPHISSQQQQGRFATPFFHLPAPLHSSQTHQYQAMWPPVQQQVQMQMTQHQKEQQDCRRRGAEGSDEQARDYEADEKSPQAGRDDQSQGEPDWVAFDPSGHW